MQLDALDALIKALRKGVLSPILKEGAQNVLVCLDVND